MSLKDLQGLPLRTGCLEDESDLNILMTVWFKRTDFGGKQGFEFSLFIEQSISSLQTSVIPLGHRNVNYLFL